MSAHVIGKSLNSLAFGVPLLAYTRRAAAKTGLEGLVYFFPYNPLGPRLPTDMLHSLYQTQYTSLCLLLCFLARRQNYPSTVIPP